jgi:hypothetical protein
MWGGGRGRAVTSQLECKVELNYSPYGRIAKKRERKKLGFHALQTGPL